MRIFIFAICAFGIVACQNVDPNFQGFNSVKTFSDGTQYIAIPDDTPMEHANRYPEQRAKPTVNDFSGPGTNNFENSH